MTGSEQQDSLSCPDCSKTFRRLPHLRRHCATIHSQSPPHACHLCGKTFNRQDSFQRHLITHGILRSPISRVGDPGVGRRHRSACNNCSRAHARCSGGLPCSRCLRNALSCRSSSSARPAERFPSPNRIESPQVDTTAGTGDGNNQFSQNTLVGPEQSNNDSVRRWFASQVNWLPVLAPENVLQPLATTTADAAHLSPSSILPETPTTTAFSDLGPSVSSGRLYTHGHGSRESQQQRPPISKANGFLLKPPITKLVPNEVFVFGFPDLSGAPGPAAPHGDNTGSVAAASYSELDQMFRALVVTGGAFYRPFNTEHFPPIGYLDECVSLFIRNATEDLPIIHSSMWHNNHTSWLVILATCTVGALYHSTEDRVQAAYSFQEFLRRAIRHALETGSIQDDILLFQAALLNAFAAINLYEASSPAVQAAYAELESLKHRPCVHDTDSPQQSRAASQQVQSWEPWIKHETRQRLKYFSWHWTFYALLMGAAVEPVEPSQLSLPFSQDLWNAESAVAWNALNKSICQPPSMYDALHSLYIERRIPSGLDGRGLISAIYGIVNRTLEVSHQLRHPLGQWNPAPSFDPESNRGKTEQVEWLPANSTYAGWRNSACDCLDLLHWRTHVEIAASAGFEGPTSLHLHLARLVLLTPFKDMIEFASYATKSYNAGKGHISIEPTNHTNNDPACPPHVCTAILRWLTLDDHKGRLSVVHAGAAFWHVRRFARNSVYEPFTVFLATLVLWIYALYQPQIRSVLAANRATLSKFEPNRRSQAEQADDQEITISDDEDSDDPTSLFLDRPCDDEIIQLFIRKGFDIEPRMFGDVRICVRSGWRRVLKEGSKLLFNCRHSSYAKAYEYQAVLLALAKEEQ